MAPARVFLDHAPRSLRRDKKKAQLNYMYATLGIEQDDSSDDDFVLEEDEKAEKEDDNEDHGPITARKRQEARMLAGEDSNLQKRILDVQKLSRSRNIMHPSEVASLHSESGEIVNVLPAFQLRTGIESWDEFDQEFEQYKRKNHLKFRIGSSGKTVLYNSTHEYQMPTAFEWTHKIYRYTHGVSQGSRSKG
ncbi:hypothetical protein PHYPSEUDO_013658 [Phytophthora pseudosyringae]|uniref:Uncharacterized protein n=1 Tax=Phytophthora pseudosyringae TaxID=221518 RepID=A0A8T1V5S1_9STRA|nr:hypothetical protein PHYPSEUDO_013658 [Phytophthora pseudosyringae]